MMMVIRKKRVKAKTKKFESGAVVDSVAKILVLLLHT